MTPKECVTMYGKALQGDISSYDSVASQLLQLMSEHYNLNDPKNQ